MADPILEREESVEESDEEREFQHAIATLPKDKLNRLKEILGIAGHSPHPHKGEGDLHPTYSLIHKRECRTCHQVMEDYFQMVWSEEMKVRVGVRVTTRPTDFQLQSIKVRWCEHCHRNLSLLTKEELLSTLMGVLREGGR